MHARQILNIKNKSVHILLIKNYVWNAYVKKMNTFIVAWYDRKSMQELTYNEIQIV